MSNDRTRRVLWISRLRPVAALFSLVLTVVLAYSFAAPYAVVAEWQLRVFGRELNILSYAVVFILGVLLALTVLIPVETRLKRSLSATELEALRNLRNVSDPWTPIILKYILFTGMAFPTMAAGWAFWNYYLKGVDAGPLSQCDIRSLENGEQPPSRFVEMRGVARWNRTIGFQRRGRSSPWPEEDYFPLVSAPDHAVHILGMASVATLHKLRERKDREVPLRGVLSRGVGNRIRRAFANSGVPLDRNVWLLEIDATPESLKELGTALLTITGVIQVIVIGIAFVVLRSKRKSSHAQPPSNHGRGLIGR
ncbi:MAG: hypothetical protein HYZ37_06100 [Candidatus Solibacter usitatus]|nr:hypothetical protein [Candidatus Solibacter usitatus]